VGYPSEIPNAIPDPKGVPPRGLAARLLDAVIALFARRRRTAADLPGRFGRGVDPRAPPITHADRSALDFERIERDLP
jgi:hypothetical protein